MQEMALIHLTGLTRLRLTRRKEVIDPKSNTMNLNVSPDDISESLSAPMPVLIGQKRPIKRIMQEIPARVCDLPLKPLAELLFGFSLRLI